MATTKVVQVLDNNITLTAGAANHTSGVATLTTGYGATLFLKNTNGATGPTVAAQSQVWVSPDNSGFYKLGGPIGWALGNNTVSSLTVNIPTWVQYCEVISGSNTGQDTTFRAELSQGTAIS